MKIVVLVSLIICFVIYFYFLLFARITFNNKETGNLFVRAIVSFLATVFIFIFIFLPIIGITYLISVIF